MLVHLWAVPLLPPSRTQCTEQTGCDKDKEMVQRSVILYIMCKQKHYAAHAPDTTTCEGNICSSVTHTAKENGESFKDKLVSLVGFSSESH